MLHGTFALLERSLRVDSRSWSTHLTRLGLMAAIYLSLCYASFTSFMYGSPGLRFFEGIAYLDATFLTLLGVGFFSTSITEEKEEDTLGLMLMAGISPLGILAGKSGGRLWQSLLLVAVQYPFGLLAVTMGGVSSLQVWSATIALLAYMVLLAGFGLLCSTLAPRGQRASAWMVAGLAIYIVVPLIFTSSVFPSSAINGPTLTSLFLGAITETCIVIRLNTILTTGFGESAWSFQVVSNVLAGVVFAGLSWLLFGVATRTPSTEASSRGLVARHRGFFRFSAQRAWNNAFIWKDFHFVTGGVGMLLIRIAYYSTLGLLALFLEEISTQGFEDAGFWWGFCLLLMWFSVVIEASRVHARSLQEEVRGQTLASLMMLPRSSVGIVYSKCAGTMCGWIPGFVISLVTDVISPNIREVFFSVDGNEAWMVLLMGVLYFTTIPHFAALFSLYVRWGAVALAIGMAILMYFGLMMGIGLLAMFVSFLAPSFSAAGHEEDLLFGGLAFIFIFICVMCHIAINLRVQALGAK